MTKNWRCLLLPSSFRSSARLFPGVRKKRMCQRHHGLWYRAQATNQNIAKGSHCRKHSRRIVEFAKKLSCTAFPRHQLRQILTNDECRGIGVKESRGQAQCCFRHFPASLWHTGSPTKYAIYLWKICTVMVICLHVDLVSISSFLLVCSLRTHLFHHHAGAVAIATHSSNAAMPECRFKAVRRCHLFVLFL